MSIVAVPREDLAAALCAINRDRWACNKDGDYDAEAAMAALHDRLSLLYLKSPHSSTERGEPLPCYAGKFVCTVCEQDAEQHRDVEAHLSKLDEALVLLDRAWRNVPDDSLICHEIGNFLARCPQPEEGNNK